MVARIWPLNKAMDEKITSNKVSTNVYTKKDEDAYSKENNDHTYKEEDGMNGNRLLLNDVLVKHEEKEG
jgi:hypothetical protein